MNLFSIFTLIATFAVGTLAVPDAALNVRGGARLGPLDTALALHLSKAATSAYIAGSASKFINRQVGGKDTELARFVTGELFQLHAIIMSVAWGMFGLFDLGLADIKVVAVGALIALGLKFHPAGITAHTIKNNALQGIIAVVLTVLAFVD